MQILPYNKREILKEVVGLNTSSIEQLISDLGIILEKRKQASALREEADLIEKIYAVTETSDYEQYQVLLNKSRNEVIMVEEKSALLKLTPQIEAKNTERLEYLMTLAKIRKVSLRTVMQQLGLSI